MIGERDVVQVLQGILRRAQTGAGAGECFVPPRVIISALRKAAITNSINCFVSFPRVCDKTEQFYSYFLLRIKFLIF